MSELDSLIGDFLRQISEVEKTLEGDPYDTGFLNQGWSFKPGHESAASYYDRTKNSYQKDEILYSQVLSNFRELVSHASKITITPESFTFEAVNGGVFEESDLEMKFIMEVALIKSGIPVKYY